MTLSEGDLAYFRDSIENTMFHFLLPFLRCADITWDESSGTILLAGEVFATMPRARDWNIDEIHIAKKFRRNNSISVVDNLGFILDINKRQRVLASYCTGYCDTKLSDKVICCSKKRHASSGGYSRKTSSFYNKSLCELV